MDIQTQESAATISLAKGIDVGKIEKELKALWRMGDDAAGVTRACTMNLVAHANAGDDINALGDDLTVVNGAHPGRVVVLVADPDAKDPRLTAEASVRCRQLGTHQIVCGEQVTLHADGPALATVNTAIAPLMLPDVPVFLWWKDIPHYEDRLFNSLADLADRVVIDSATFDNPHEDTRHLAEILSTHKEFGHFSDLNWGRLTSWRTLLASFWDVADYRPFLDKIDRVTVSYDPPDSNRGEIAAQALLVVGWLASRLGWEVIKGESGTEASWFTLRDAGRDIVIEMRPETDREGHDAFLSSISLSSQGRASFYIGINWEGPKLETKAHLDGSQAVGRVLFYEQKTAAQRLTRELGILKRDGIYEATIKVAANMLAALK